MFPFSSQSLQLYLLFPSLPNGVHIIMLPTPTCTLNTNLKETILSTHSLLSYLRVWYCGYKKNANVLLKAILFGCGLHKWSEHKAGFATKGFLESQETMGKPSRGGLVLNSFWFFITFISLSVLW